MNREVKNNIILGIAIFSFIISEFVVYSFAGDFCVILTHLLYFPIIFTSFKYPRLGVITSLLIGLGYLGGVALFVLPDTVQLIPALTQFYVYVSVSIVVSSLSGKMKMNEMRYGDIFNNSGNGICLMEGATGRVIEQNGRCMDLLRCSDIATLWKNSDEKKAFFERVKQKGAIEGYEVHRVTMDGRVQDLILSASRLPEGEVVVSITDITERKRAERESKEHEGHFKSLADNMLEAAVIMDQNGAILFGNKSAAALAGLSAPQDLIGKDYLDFLHPKYHRSAQYDLDAVFHDRGGYLAIYEIKTVKGDIRWIEALGGKISYNGSPAMLVTVRDITTRKHEEQKTRVQRDLGLGLASTSSIEVASQLCVGAAVDVAGMDCGGLFFFDTGTDDPVLSYAYDLPEDIVKAISRYGSDSERMTLVRLGIPVFTDGGAFRDEFDNATALDDLKAIGMIPFMEKGETIGCIIIASHNMDEIPQEIRADLETIAAQVGNAIARIQAEVSTNESRDNLQMLFDSLDDFIFVTDTEGKILHMNPVVETRLGYTREELLGMNMANMHPPWAREQAVRNVGEMVQGARNSCPLPLLTKCGEEIPVETKVAHGWWGDQKALFAITRDITARKCAEDALQRRDAILYAVSFAAGKFLHDTRWEDHLSEVLRQLGEATGTSRAYLFENHISPETGELLCSYRNEWCSDGIEPQVESPDLQNVPRLEDFPRWHDILSEGWSLSGNVRDFPETERAYLEPQGILSLAVMPVFVDGRWWGFLGFDDCTTEREWTQTEVDALTAAANIIGSAIHRAMMDEVFRKPVEKSLVGTYLLQDSVIRYVNPKVAEMFGYPREDLIDNPYAPLIHPDDLPLVEEYIQRRIAGEIDSAHYEFRGTTKTGEEIILEAYGNAISYKGEPAVIGTIMDITSRKRAEKALLSGKERLELALRGADLGLFDWYIDTGKIVVNERWAAMLGYRVEEIEPHISSWERLLHPDDSRRVQELLQGNIEGKTPAYFSEHRLLAKSGAWKWVLAQGKVVRRDPQGRALRMTGTHLDITDRKKAEERIEHLNLVILAVRNVNELILRIPDRDELIQQACESLIETRGYHSAWIALFDDEGLLIQAAEAGIGECFHSYVEQMQRGEMSICSWNALKNVGITMIRDPVISCADSSLAPHYAGFGLLSIRLAHEGEVYGLLNISLPRDLVDDEEEKALFREVAGDISFALHSIKLEDERKEAEKELRIKDNAIASSINGMAIFDLDGNLTYVNDSFLDLWGYESSGEVIGRPVKQFILHELQGIDLLDALYDQGYYVGEIAAKKRDGTIFDGLTHASLVLDDSEDPVCFMISVVDVTETRRAEEALRESEVKYRSIFDTAQIGILVAQDEKVKYINPSIAQLLDLAGTSFVGAIHPDDRSIVLDHYHRRIAGEEVPAIYQFRMLLGDEGVIWMELHAFLFSWEGRPAVLCFLIDITDRKDYEEQIKASLDEKLVLLMEIHHRVKNNLQIISGLIKLQSRYIQDETAVSSLRECENRIITMALVHESLYQSENLAQINAREHFEKLASNILRSDAESAHIGLDVDIEDIALNLDTAIPCSLIINELLINSLKYAFDGHKTGTITISLHHTDEGLLKLCVADDGVGLPEGFDINTASSLGLKLVLRLVQAQLGGTLDVEGDHGTKFVMTFSEKNKS